MKNLTNIKVYNIKGRKGADILTDILLIIVIVLLIINIFISRKPNEINLEKLNKDIEKKFDDIERSFRQEFYTNREESRRNEQDNRQEIKVSIDSLTSSISRHIMNLSTLQQNQFDINSKSLENTLNSFNENMMKSLDNLAQLQNEKLSQLTKVTEEKFTSLTKSTENNLEKMRVTVDEKLQNTLEKRLGESFKMVNDRLEQVYKGLGEMQNLATGVGDLKKVLSNVKTRGVLGEIQLERILEQFLAPEQYSKNVITKKGSRETVEFAIKLPGKDEIDTIYLPLDAKFPLDIYNKLIDAY